MSGLLASDGCQDVEVISNAGLIEHRSMVYTEYFARGTAPTALCDLHPTHGIMTKLAGLFGGNERPAPPRIEDTGIPASTATAGTTGTITTVPASDVPPEPPKAKRGFWSRMFHRGNDSSSTPQPPPAKKKGG